jgi:hypothetical protein
MHQAIGEHTKTQANHCLLMVSYFLNWCEKQEYRNINTNPVRLIRKFRTKGRDRVLSDSDRVPTALRWSMKFAASKTSTKAAAVW